MRNTLRTTAHGHGLSKISTPLLLLVSIALLLITALLVSRDWKQTVSVTQVTLSDSFHTPAVVIRDTRSPSKGIAILVHGHHCNKSMMVQLGKYLATRGLTVFAIDLPGHGESELPFTEDKSKEAAATAVAQISRLSETEHLSIILIGHSFGATVLGPVASARQDIAASIFLGPGKIETLRQDVPSNVMIITGEHDYEHIKKHAYHAFRDLTGQPDPTPTRTAWADMRSGTGRAWIEIPQATHLSLLYSRDVYQAAGEWIERALQTPLSSDRFATFPLLLVALPLVISSVAALLLSQILRVTRVAPVPVFSSALQPMLVCAYALVLGTILSVFAIQLRFMHIMEGEILISFLGSIGVVGLVVMLALGRTRSIPSVADLYKPLSLAVLTFITLYWSLNILVGLELYHLTFPLSHGGRMRAFYAGFLSLMPFFVVGESVRCYFLKPGAGVPGIFISTLACVFFYAACLGILTLAGSSLTRFVGPFMLITAYCVIIGSIFYRATRSVIPSAVFSSLVVSWLTSVGFIYY
jgi:pimeloyl-ACP methyl ester carboxylesterase